MIQQERIKYFNQQPIQNRRFILYWMQASQRTEFNHALETAISKANELDKPLVVYFGLNTKYPEANARHFFFMLQGIQEVQKALAERGIKMIIQKQSPEIGVPVAAASADLVVTDTGYLRIQKNWRNLIAGKIDCPLIQVESDVVVPVETASDKENWTAATLRPRIKKYLRQFLVPVEKRELKNGSLNLDPGFESISLKNIDALLLKSKIDHSVKKTPFFNGGTSQARAYLDKFLEIKIEKYTELRNSPALDYLSNMSPYLHFGQISPLHIALKALECNRNGVDAFLEELIIRRELSMNLAHYNPDYDLYEKVLPDWAQRTLAEHEHDPREYTYSLDAFEKAETHDLYWNAAQAEMVLTGKMHGYMRMYWGKKILEWSSSPRNAFNIALFLNNKYELDGRDPNSYAGVAWCFGKHDRAWSERPVFGKIRYMNATGLKRKFDADAYVKRIHRLEQKLKS